MLDPIVKTVTLDTTPARAFELFTARIAEWWPVATHSLLTAAGETPKEVQFEPFKGGRLFETSASGKTEIWGEVRTWVPGQELAFTWQVGTSPEQATQVHVSFTPADAGGTRVTLTHSNWEILGDLAASQHANYTPGWDQVFHQGFAAFAERVLSAA